MSLLRARAALRTIPKYRRYSTESQSAYQKEYEATKHHAVSTTELWRKISIYGCIPAIAICCAWVYNAEQAHAAHAAHVKHEMGDQEPIRYDYMNRRVKPFPWGNNSLFFNPEVQRDMDKADE